VFPIKTTELAVQALAVTLIAVPKPNVETGMERYPIVALPTLNPPGSEPTTPLANVPA
jgi:hypothetical protein